MTSDQLIWLSCCVSAALLAVQACFVWQLISDVKTLQHQRKTAEDLRELHAEMFVEHEFAAKTAAVRSLKVNDADFQACQQRQLEANFGPQKSPSSGAAVRAQQRQLAAELEESE